MAKKAKKKKDVKEDKVQILFSKLDGQKSLKVGKKVLTHSPSLVDISEVIEVNNKVGTAKLSNGLIVKLYYDKSKELIPLNSSVNQTKILVMGRVAKKIIQAYNLDVTIQRLATSLQRISRSEIEGWGEDFIKEMNDKCEELQKLSVNTVKNDLPF